MTNTHENKNAGAVIIITIATLVLTILVPVHLRLSPYAFDDAYIHYRIANNLSQYGVPYFNPEEPIMASTSSGWTIFLALLFKLIPTNLQLLGIINALFSVVGAVIFAQLVFKLAPTPLPGWLYGFFIILYICLIFQSSTGLMETPLALLLLGLAFRLLLEKKASRLSENLRQRGNGRLE